ncbi:hypothetical protein OWR29_37645 [Actinoplanes sp. Pm04-4]|uniref:Uncharacterized protein n=1 Tax=Paractinoplanes pyxinae TaxID=2997416 RepID=A0ABT4BDT0_9ACTN|nr:hypothetical protein [Actinoplanes pyxinae]MCY1143758.1 hypothetical protein [Actinoplanes pyxinae]
MRHVRTGAAVLAVATVSALAAVVAAASLPASAAAPFVVLVDLALVSALTLVFHRTARLPGAPPATARFWASLTRALAAYALGMAVDLTGLVVAAVRGREVPMFGAQLIYPIAGLLTLYAVFRYPTTTRNRSQQVRIGLDAGIVLLGAASFIWYFSVGNRWSPGSGWLSLSETLALPVMVLVAGFGVLRVALVGTRLLARPTAICFAACVLLAGIATALPARPGVAALAPTVLLLTAQLLSLTGALFQYRITASGTAQSPGRVRRPFSALPYAASVAAFGLLVFAIGPVLDARRWGVLVASVGCSSWSPSASSRRCRRITACWRRTGASPIGCGTRLFMTS